MVSCLIPLVPVFFIMSGFLRKRHFSKEALFKQVIKYGAVYLAVDYLAVLYVHIKMWLGGGGFNPAEVATFMLKGLFFNYRYVGQLWFIPALLYPMLLNAFLNDRSRKIVIAVSAVLFVLLNILGDARLGSWLGEKFSSFFRVADSVSASGMMLRWRRVLIGLLFTTIGFDIDTWKVKPSWLLVCAVVFWIIESSTCYLGVAVILMSILFFYLVKRIPGQFLRPYHMEISLFSCLMYFLHIFERNIFHTFTDSRPLNFFLIFTLNLAVTVAVSFIVRRKRQAPELERV